MSDATPPGATLAGWRARVEEELAGRPFGKALVHRTLEGLAIEPLYTEAPALPRLCGDGAPIRVCMHHDADTTRAAVLDDLDGGADALWLAPGAAGALPERLPEQVLVLADGDDGRTCSAGGRHAALVSTLGPHAEGADACDEIAFALSATVARLAAEDPVLVVRVASGRDTFVELCKLRALRLCLRKVLAAYGADPALLIHAVASPRTVTAHAPRVNLIRVTTEAFAAILGGADLVTPLPFDHALEVRTPLGRRIARNTVLVLREESALGRVADPAAGSWYLDTLTDALAREAWTRFRALEAEGGIDAPAAAGSLARRIAATRAARLELVATRKMPVVGVSEFADPGETPPSRPRTGTATAPRDGAAFERLRDRAAGFPAGRTAVVLATLGPPAEWRARAVFARGFFAAGGLRARELADGESAPPGSVACVCGSDERYASEAVARVRDLRAAGCRSVLLAGRPGPLEAALRAAGANGFLFLGCNAVEVLAPLLEVAP